MLRKIFALLLTLTLTIGSATPAVAGGFLETWDITANTPSPIPGHIAAPLIPIRWDDRSLPVRYTMNNTLDPIPNPLGAPVLTLAQAAAALQASLDQWNAIPTSYIAMNVGPGGYANPGVRGFDFVNELTFRTAAGFTAIASSPSVSLIADVTLVNGDDIDGDGDSDVSSAIAVVTDFDNDGDLEFPAGFYEAGTILDNDVQFNTKTTNGLRFTVGAAALDTVVRSVDLQTVAVHEFGHSLGLSHSLDNQISTNEGDGATMFPFIDTGDPEAELRQQILGTDDIAWASMHYPEGTKPSGPGALQPGDKKFSSVYGIVRGEARHGRLNGEPIAGASVYAIDRGANAVIASGYSGTTQVSYNPVNGGLFLVSPEFNILDGAYAIPLPKGNYDVGIEALDGNPAAAGNISISAQIGSIFGQLDFNEEFYNRNKESAVELRNGQVKNVHVNPGKEHTGVALTTPLTINVNNFGTRDFIGFTGAPAGRYYAVRVPVEQVQAAIDAIDAANPGHDILVQGIAYDNVVADASVVPRFAEAALATGTLNGDGSVATIDLANPLERTASFVGADNDFAPLFFKNPHELGRKVRDGIANGTIQHLFMVLRVPTTTPFPGVSALPPLIGLDGGVATNDVPIFGLSYTSDNGGASFARNSTFNFRFSLVLSEPAN